jgi:hypothetical protein
LENFFGKFRPKMTKWRFFWNTLYLILFRLAGYAPFYHRQQLRMMRMIQEGRFDFPKEQWDTISDEAKDLVCIKTLSLDFLNIRFANFSLLMSQKGSAPETASLTNG